MRKKAKRTKTWNDQYTITPSGMLPGKLGECAFALLFPDAQDVANKKLDWDFEYCGLKIDVKTKRRSKLPPLQEYNQDVNCKNKKGDMLPEADIFFFFSIDYALDEYTVDGWITRGELMQSGVFCKKGERNPDRKAFVYKKDCWTIYLHQLRSLKEFNHATLTKLHKSLSVGS